MDVSDSSVHLTVHQIQKIIILKYHFDEHSLLLIIRLMAY